MCLDGVLGRLAWPGFSKFDIILTGEIGRNMRDRVSSCGFRKGNAAKIVLLYDICDWIKREFRGWFWRWTRFPTDQSQHNSTNGDLQLTSSEK